MLSGVRTTFCWSTDQLALTRLEGKDNSESSLNFKQGSLQARLANFIIQGYRSLQTAAQMHYCLEIPQQWYDVGFYRDKGKARKYILTTAALF